MKDRSDAFTIVSILILGALGGGGIWMGQEAAHELAVLKTHVWEHRDDTKFKEQRLIEEVMDLTIRNKRQEMMCNYDGKAGVARFVYDGKEVFLVMHEPRLKPWGNQLREVK